MPDSTRVFGTMRGGMPFLSFGSGPPLVVLPGISANHAAPTGGERRALTQPLLPFAQARRLWWVNRRPSLALDTTMAELARDYAVALRSRFDGKLLSEEGVYPHRWDDKPEAQLENDILPRVEAMREYYRSAAERGNAMVFWIS